MSEVEVQELHEQLRRLRGRLPDFLQAVTRLDDSKDTRTAFYTVSQALNSWMQESSTFLEKYQQLKEQVGEDKPEEKKQPEPQPQPEFNGGFGADDGFGNEFFDLT